MSVYLDSSSLAAREIYHRWFDTEDGDIWSECISLLDEILADGDPSGEVNYIYGMLVYERQCELGGDTDAALEFFLAAVVRNPSHYMAHLYAGHCHHDKLRYEEALEEYRLVDAELLKKEYPVWRFVKFLEQQGECLHHIGDTDLAFNIFTEVLNYYKITPFEDLVDPQEVFRVLESGHPIVVSLRRLMEFSGTNLG